MPPLEKLKQIQQRFRDLGYTNDNEIKEMSDIVIKEVIGQWEYIDTYIADMCGELNPNLKYWYQVLESNK